jgi:hypothetical protein
MKKSIAVIVPICGVVAAACVAGGAEASTTPIRAAPAPEGACPPRAPAAKASQLYITGIVVEGGKITTYPGVYLWNQPTDTSNNTPAWDVFQIPSVPPPK